MSYCTNCPRNCQSFREHVGNGPYVSGTAMPTRSNVAKYAGNEEKWDKDIRAFNRLQKEGANLQSADGAAEFEQRATQPVELQNAKLYGPERAKTVQKLVDGEYH